ncbi:hypothetical protein B0H65DRAFT_329626 [Neurospora tetraspora]|uniref:Uncharacterized protein n=1 Tax=Neurospora tetraspora TaxID=94610 RepID=A0AAE0J0I1_9PEZI|nr:hypothetical protein B0H65DRAFT_329626 [Neurospora tetraspora]
MALRISFIGASVTSRSGERANKVVLLSILSVDSQSPSRGWHMTGVGRGHQLHLFCQGQDQEGREVRYALESQGWRLRRTRICGIIMIF